MTEPVDIAGRLVGPGHPALVIAEVSANHGHDLERVLEMVRVAAASGADAVKLQTFTADTMTLDLDLPQFVVGPDNPWSGRRLYELYREAEMPWEWYPTIATAAAEAGVILFSSPFDATSIDFLVEVGAPALKIASFELTDLPLIAHAAATGLPLIMSTGMATDAEVDDAVRTARAAGNGGIALLRCNSAYPSPPEDMNLRTIIDLADRWDVPVGLSDHTLDHVCATVAIGLGASIVEKHFTMARSLGGPDSTFSLEPDELASLVSTIRTAEAALGSTRYGPSSSDRASLAFRRSLYVVAPVRAGEPLTVDNVRSLRPAGGLPPRHLPDVIGRPAVRDLGVGHPLSRDDVG
ncbi:MAG: pseudaminic acid synthase [Mycobacterium sp.]|nr:MAG: pseudaminic acid synthase [Mycobacterium sp.]